MPTITHKRRAIQRTINWPAYREQRAYLADMFAVIAYSGQAKRPLSIGIKHDLIGANTGLSAAEVKNFLRAYTFGPRYLRALTVGANRLGLDGTPRGYVTAEESAHAALCLKAHYADREWHRALKAARVDAPVEDSDWAVDVREAAEQPHSWCKYRPGDRVMNGTNERYQGTVVEARNDVNGPVRVKWDNGEDDWCGADCLYTPVRIAEAA